jgi:hypothetical protein
MKLLCIRKLTSSTCCNRDTRVYPFHEEKQENIMTKFVNYLYYYLKESSVHGFQFIGNEKGKIEK